MYEAHRLFSFERGKQVEEHAMGLSSSNQRLAILGALAFLLVLLVSNEHVGRIKVDVAYRLKGVAFGQSGEAEQNSSSSSSNELEQELPEEFGKIDGLQVFETSTSDGDVVVATLHGKADLEAREPQFDAASSNDIPVVVFYKSDYIITESHYLWRTLRPAIAHDNKVFFITDAQLEPPADLKGKFERVELNTLETDELARFVQIYKGWGLKEPWESFNFRRYFYLRELMRQRSLDWVFFADSDVALLTKLRKSEQLIQGCDAFIDMRDYSQSRVLDWSKYYWSFWAGSSIMSAQVLNDWIDFVLKGYSDENFVKNILGKKKAKKPFVCDMTLWYLYSVAADPIVRSFARAEDKVAQMPLVPQRHLCASNLMGFDHALAFRKPGFSFDSKQYTARMGGERLLSIHFQGLVGKKALQKYFTKPIPGAKHP